MISFKELELAIPIDCCCLLIFVTVFTTIPLVTALLEIFSCTPDIVKTVRLFNFFLHKAGLSFSERHK